MSDTEDEEETWDKGYSKKQWKVFYGKNKTKYNQHKARIRKAKATPNPDTTATPPAAAAQESNATSKKTEKEAKKKKGKDEFMDRLRETSEQLLVKYETLSTDPKQKEKLDTVCEAAETSAGKKYLKVKNYCLFKLAGNCVAGPDKCAMCKQYKCTRTMEQVASGAGS